MRLKTTVLIEQLEWMALNRIYSMIEVSPRTLSRLSFGVPIYPSYAALHQLTRLVSYSRSHTANRCTGKMFPSINSAFKIIQICFLLWRWYFVYSASEQMEVSQGIRNTLPQLTVTPCPPPSPWRSVAFILQRQSFSSLFSLETWLDYIWCFSFYWLAI